MKRVIPKQSVAITTACLLLSPMASADISYTQHIRVVAAGAMSMLSSEGDVVTKVAGDKSRSESSIAMESKLVGALAGSGDTASIIRLDKQLTWNLLPEKESYTELSFTELRQQMAQLNQSLPQSGSGTLPVNEEACQWNEGDLQIEHPGGIQQVANIDTNRHVVRLKQTCSDPESGKTCELTWLMETWLAQKVPAEQEVRAFQRKYAESLGMGDALASIQGPGRSLISMFSGNWEKLEDEFEKMEGYPMRTIMQMGIGGEDCTTASGQPIALDAVWENATTSAYNAALDQAGREAGNAVGRAAGESFGQSVGGSIGGRAVGAAAGEIIGGLSGMFKKSKPEPEPQPAQQSADGQVTVFRITTEVTDWSESTIPAHEFEVPTGWKRLSGR